MITLSVLLFCSGLLAWLISTIAAGGAATLLLPILSQILGPTYVAPVITAASLAVNPARVFLFRRFIDWPILARMTAGSVIGVIIGAWCFKSISPHYLQILTGLFLISTPLHPMLAKKRSWKSFPRNGIMGVAVIVGTLSTVIGATGPLYNPFLFQLGLDKESLIATKSLGSLWLQVIKLIAYGWVGLSVPSIFHYIFFLGIGGMAGVFLADRVLHRVSPEKFKQIVYLYMPLSGVIMVIQGFR